MFIIGVLTVITGVYFILKFKRKINLNKTI